MSIKCVSHDILIYDFVDVSISWAISELVTITLINLVFLKDRSKGGSQFLDVP